MAQSWPWDSQIAVKKNHRETVQLLLECIHIDDYGGDACDSKHTIDKVILTHYNIPKERYIKLLCVCVDEASINMGKYKGIYNRLSF